jgi:hypothetical protein
MQKIYLTIFAATLLNVLFFSECSAAFQVGPLKQQISVAPGSLKETVTVSIVNSSSQQKSYLLKVLGARQLEDGKVIYGKGITPAEEWVAPESEKILLSAGEAKDVKFIIKTPNDAKAGSYYLGLTVEQASDSLGAIGVSGQIISVLLLQVSGTVNESLEIIGVTAPKVSAGKILPYTFSIMNNGAAAVPVDAEVIARNIFGQEVFVEKVLVNAYLLPGAARKYGGNAQFSRWNLPGPYQLQFKMKYGLTGQTVTMIKTVWYLPPFYILLIIILIAAVVITIVRKRKNKNQEI